MSDGGNHGRPLLPTTVLDSQSPQFRRVVAPFDPQQSRSGRSSKCFVYLLVFVVFLAVFLLVSSLVVARVDTPKVAFRSAALKSFRYSYPGGEPASFNTTVVGVMEVRNPNYLEYEHGGGEVRVWYMGKVMGEGRVRRGKVKGKGREKGRVEVRVDSKRGLGRKYGERTQELWNEMNAGKIGMRVTGEVKGEFSLLKIIKMSRTVGFHCTFNIDFRTRKIVDLLCQ